MLGGTLFVARCGAFLPVAGLVFVAALVLLCSVWRRLDPSVEAAVPAADTSAI